MACRRRAPGWSDTVSPEVHDLRMRRKRPSAKHCKRSNIHHAVAEVQDEAEEEAEGGKEEEEPFDPLMG